MVTKYVKSKSGYCYKMQGNKKIRISKEEYKNKTQAKRGGQGSQKRSFNVPTIHYSNIKEKQSIANCKDKCNNGYKYRTLEQKLRCVDSCRYKSITQKSPKSSIKSVSPLKSPSSMFSTRRIVKM